MRAVFSPAFSASSLQAKGTCGPTSTALPEGDVRDREEIMETTTQVEAETQVPEGPVFPEGTKLREYETIYLHPQEQLDEAVERTKERLRALIVRDGGKVLKFTIWGKKKTSFEVARQNRAIFVHMQYLGPASLVAEVERNLRMFDDVVRFQTIKLGDEVDANKPAEQDVKLAGDVEQPDRPPREDRGDRGDSRGSRDRDDDSDTDSDDDSDDDS